MNLQRFMAILTSMEPGVVNVPPDAPLYNVAFMIVADRWIRNVPDDLFSQELREELKYFVKHMKFSWQLETKRE